MSSALPRTTSGLDLSSATELQRERLAIKTIEVQFAIEPVSAAPLIAMFSKASADDVLLDDSPELVIVGQVHQAKDSNALSIQLDAVIATDHERIELNRNWPTCILVTTVDDSRSQLHLDVVDHTSRKLLAATIDAETNRALYVQCTSMLDDLKLEGGRYDPPTITFGE